MIVRVWRGRTRAADAERYLAYLEATGVRDLRATPGNRGVRIFRRLAGDEAEFMLCSWWESSQAIAAFAGPDVDRARYYPEDAVFLLELEPGVRHYVQVLEATDVAR